MSDGAFRLVLSMNLFLGLDSIQPPVRCIPFSPAPQRVQGPAAVEACAIADRTRGRQSDSDVPYWDATSGEIRRHPAQAIAPAQFLKPTAYPLSCITNWSGLTWHRKRHPMACEPVHRDAPRPDGIKFILLTSRAADRPAFRPSTGTVRQYRSCAGSRRVRRQAVH